MQKLDRLALKVFLFGLPVVIALAIADSFIGYESLPTRSSVVQTIYNLSGLIFGIWMILSLVLSLRLLVSRDFREEVLSRLALIQERDEREIQVSGQAAKITFLTSLAILICLFCLATFKVALYEVPPDQAPKWKNHTITLGFNLGLTETRSAPVQEVAAKPTIKTLFSYSRLPFSKGVIILFLILWQIGSYNFVLRNFYRMR